LVSTRLVFENRACLVFEIPQGYAANEARENAVSARFPAKIKKRVAIINPSVEPVPVAVFVS